MSTNKGFEGWGPNFKCGACGHVHDLIPDDASCDKCLERPRNWDRVPGDEKLLRYLYENNHATPFEMAGLIIEVQAPIFVFREWHRHRTQSYNEMSARYTPLPDLNYIPTVDRLLLNNKENKQAGTVRGAHRLDDVGARSFIRKLQARYDLLQDDYEMALKEGVPKELARILLPMGRYSRMRASANLRNWIAFLTLRQAPNAQWEIRAYANAVADLVAEHFPRTYALYMESKD